MTDPGHPVAMAKRPAARAARGTGGGHGGALVQADGAGPTADYRADAPDEDGQVVLF
jgi:hypothetical protein